MYLILFLGDIYIAGSADVTILPSICFFLFVFTDKIITDISLLFID